MFSFLSRNKQPRPAVKPQTRPQKRRADLNVEELEGRLVPARIDFLPGASYIVGTASLSSTSSGPYTRTNSVSVSGGSWNGTIKRVYSTNNSLAESYARLNYWNLSSRSKRVELTSFANATAQYRNAWAATYTSPRFNEEQRGWIGIKISPTGAGEYIGKPVTVTLTANVQVNKGYTGYSYNDIRIWRGGSSVVILRGENMGFQSRTITHNTTIGSTFYIHMNSYAKAASYTSVNAVSRLDIKI
jgi:hypothetical protein